MRGALTESLVACAGGVSDAGADFGTSTESSLVRSLAGVEIIVARVEICSCSAGVTGVLDLCGLGFLFAVEKEPSSSRVFRFDLLVELDWVEVAVWGCSV
jgi:hypothetical protein